MREHLFSAVLHRTIVSLCMNAHCTEILAFCNICVTLPDKSCSDKAIIIESPIFKVENQIRGPYR